MKKSYVSHVSQGIFSQDFYKKLVNYVAEINRYYIETIKERKKKLFESQKCRNGR